MNKVLQTTIVIGIISFFLALYLSFAPIPFAPIKWDAHESRGYVGPHQKNTKLANMNYLDLGNYSQPEHLVYRSNWLYAAMKDGEIIRIRPDGSEIEEVVNTNGRPLGFDFDLEGSLIIADPMYGDHGGLIKVTNLEGEPEIELLTNAVEGTPILFADAVVVASNGMIYFTDASQKVRVKDIGDVGKAGELDILGNSSSGRLLEYNPTTQKTRIIMRDLSFANGIVLSKDEQQIIINETGKYRVWKVDVAAENISANEISDHSIVLIDNLPGLPDNLMRGRDNRIWIGLVHPRNDFLDFSADKPWLRAIVMRLPHFLLPKGKGYAHVIAIDESGAILDDLQSSSGTFTDITGVTETEQSLYFHTLNNNRTIGWIRY
ncbi:SMP-30/gluconolactonase/LRE family protein [Anaerobacillus alkaliphilus]|uniref:SMP-30/gluconolactonase/LRE family protein n=1 Tax=Anaerobacillus alkaliphilus TaxID=1548597 RepID=A0A4Q0VLH6_9BACI|nr:SMP-30/gluconolactonase/LRE family protein [Anaerobacillus alkaliphilus]RXI96238.1 SMP-30/gluconolactonase/LRE family protein [Anaerobacillus alkaliphilus]